MITLEEKKKQQSKFARDWYLKNKQRTLLNIKKWQEQNKEKVREYKKKWKKNNKELLLKKQKERLKTDPQYKLTRRLRKRIWDVLNKEYKSKKTLELLGCTIEEFKKYIESKFTKGMSWDKMHLIHIDHIKPCISFDLTNPEEQAKCFHYTNLQPLWAIDNLKKGAKYDKIR